MTAHAALLSAVQSLLESPAPNSRKIVQECIKLAAFLVAKNTKYGDSALNPVRIFSRADSAAQIRVRIDDKLSRLLRGEAGQEDTLQDLVGYWVLLQIAEKQEAKP